MHAQAQRTFILGDSVKYRREWFGCVVLNLASQATYFFNRTAAYVLESFAEPSTLESVQAELPHVEIESFVDNLLRTSLLQPSDDNQSLAEIFNTDTTDFPSGYFYTPLGVEIELTRRCLRRCAYCAYEAEPKFKTSGEMSLLEWQGVLRDAKSCGVLFMRFTGGDPLLKDGAFDLFRYASDLGMLVTVGSDLTRFDAQMAGTLRSIPNFHLLQTTLDGPDKITADALRGKGNFDRVVHATALLREYEVPFVIGMVVTKLNFERVAETAALAYELGAKQFVASPLYAAGRGATLGHLMLTKDEAEVAHAQYLRSSRNNDIAVNAAAGDSWDLLPDAIRSPDRFLRVDPQGKAYPSIKVESQLKGHASVADVRDHSIANLWRSPDGMGALRAIAPIQTSYGPLLLVKQVVEDLEIRNAQRV